MVQSLFGLTPEQIQQARQLQQQQLINEQAKSFGMFGPLYAASRGLSQTGINALAQGLFPEAQDPELRKAADIQTLMQGFDPNNPAQSYIHLATALAQRGYGREAAMAAAEANKYTGQTEDRDLRRQEIEARTKAAEAQAASTEAAAEERRTKITTIGTTSKRLTTYRKGTDPTIYVMNEKGEEEQYKPTIHGGYEIAEDRRTPPAPSRPATITDAYKNQFILNPDGTLGPLILPGLVPPGQIPKAAPGAAPATGKLKYEPGKGLVGGNK